MDRNSTVLFDKDRAAMKIGMDLEEPMSPIPASPVLSSTDMGEGGGGGEGGGLLLPPPLSLDNHSSVESALRVESKEEREEDKEEVNTFDNEHAHDNSQTLSKSPPSLSLLDEKKSSQFSDMPTFFEPSPPPSSSSDLSSLPKINNMATLLHNNGYSDSLEGGGGGAKLFGQYGNEQERAMEMEREGRRKFMIKRKEKEALKNGGISSGKKKKIASLRDIE